MMPYDFRLMVKLFRRAFGESPPPGRSKLLWILMVVLPFIAAFNAVCFALDRVLFPAFRKVEIREPVFIIGHPRSGTSLLHRLMCTDEESFSWFMTYELFFPSLLQHKFIRLLGRLDQRLLGGAIDARRRAWEDRVFARGREMHPMSLTGPEEDEFLMALPFCSSTVSMIFPYLDDVQKYQAFDRMLPEKQRRRVMNYYRECVRRQVYLNGSSKIHLSKNPLFSEKVRSLKEFFPGARFAICVRSPHEAMPSIAKMMKRNWKASDCSPEQISESLKLLFDNSLGLYVHPFEDLEGEPEDRWTVVRYEDLIERPSRTVRGVYEALGIPLPASAEEQLRAAEKEARAYRPDHRYSLAEFGMTTEEIEKRLAPIFDRFEWPTPELS